ncbi:MAG: metallophosphoesterase family protein [Candidatus Omnitrophota bacterium]
MRYGIFSDVHGNIEAFTTAIEFYEKEKIDTFLFLGDIVGYGANPKEAISLLRTLNPVSIAGNHDWAVIDKLSADYFNEYAKEAVVWTKAQLEEAESDYLRNFPLTYQDKNFLCVHGSLDNPEDFNYIWGVNDARENLELLKTEILFVGHSHRAQIYYKNKKGIFYHSETSISLKKGEKYIINVGSVGQPRDRDSRLSLCIYDSDEGIVSIKRLGYNIQLTAEKITKAGLPQILASRLFVGC